MSKRYTQKEIERLYSQRNIKSVLHDAIQEQLNGILLNWTLKVFFKLEEYLAAKHSERKQIRVNALKQQIDQQGMEEIIIAVVAAVIHTHKPQTLQQCIGYLQGFIKQDVQFDRVRTAAEILALCSSPKGFFTIARKGSGNAVMVTVNYWPTIDNVLLDEFDWINDTLFNPPLVEKPAQVSNNDSCGYHTFNEPLILGVLTQHDLHQDYDTINILNQIPWILDQKVLEEPEKSPTPLDTAEKQRDFMHYMQQCQHVYQMLNTRPLFLAWQYDSRGRFYSHGYHVNFQSHEYKKAMLSFDHFEQLT